MSFLSVQQVGLFPSGKTPVNEVSFTLRPNERMAIAGQTGSGKSSLLKIIAGLLQPQFGQVLLQGKRVLGPDEQLIAGHKKIAYLSQHFELRNNYRVQELLNMVNEMEEKDAQKVFEICRIHHLVKRKTHELSGGEKQRIALAKLLITKPKLLILDEPFSNLDYGNKQIIQAVVHDYLNTFQVACIMVSHEATEVLNWANKLAVLQNGQLVQCEDPKSVFYKPVNENVANLLGAYNLIEPSAWPYLATNVALHLVNKKIFLRPIQISIGKQQPSSLAGTITQIQFFGNYYIYTVTNAHHRFQVAQLKPDYKINDEVFLNVADNSGLL